MSKKILGCDIGFGDTKVTLYSDSGELLKIFKFPSMVGATKKNEFINDNRIYDYKDYAYYVGENASHVPSDNIVSITEYKNLEYYAPLFLYHAIKLLGETPDVIVTGLSKAQINNSGHFKEALMEFNVNKETFKFDEVYVLPQGAGSKLTIDKYGTNFPQEQTDFLGSTTFVGCDAGMNTLDMFLVTDGKTSANLFEGIEKEGVMKIATEVAKKVKEVHGRQISLQEAKEIIDTGIYKLRGASYPFKDYVDDVKKEYLKNLFDLIEEKYNKILDKCDFIFLSGGGSTIFKSSEDGFVKVPKTKHEFYNAIGFGLWGVNKVNS
jgi:hypothetical protein